MKKNTWKRLTAIGIALEMMATSMPVELLADETLSANDWSVVSDETEEELGAESALMFADEAGYDSEDIIAAEETGTDEVADPGIIVDDSEYVLQAAESTESSGKCGDSLFYTLDADNNLTISGTGDMYDYDSASPPWGKNISSATIQEGVTSIGNYAFYFCSALTALQVPSTIKRIGDYAFRGCDALTGSFTISKNVESIGCSVFSGSGFQSIIIEEGCTATIGEKAFWNTYLKELYIPDTITDMQKSAFEYSCELERVHLPSGLTSIDGFFLYCFKLKEVNIPAGVTEITPETFSSCSKLTELSLPAGLTSIGSSAFDSCTSLKRLEIPSGVTAIGANAFCKCTALTELVLPETVTDIGNNAFRSCTGLATLSLPASIESIDTTSMFKHCTSLKSMTLPECTASIGNDAFRECSSLEEITIPEGVKSIGDAAFKDCTALEIINYKGTPEEWSAITVGSDNESLQNAEVRYITICNILYELDGGTNHEDNPARIAVNAEPVTLKEPSKQDYVFKGWFTDLSSDSPVTEISTDSWEPITLYAKWGREKYTIRYELYGGVNNSGNPSEYDIDDPEVVLKDAEKEGFRFGGWYLDSGYQERISVIETNRKENLILHAKWEVPVTGISINSGEISLYTGRTYQLLAGVEPSDADNKKILWSTSDETVAAVSSEGIVTGIGQGTAIITAVSEEGGFQATCQVEVTYNPKLAEGISLDHTELELLEDETAALTASLSPKDAYDQRVKWTSSDESVVKVETIGDPDADLPETGDTLHATVTANMKGTAVITAQTVDGDFIAECSITVRNSYTIRYDSNGGSGETASQENLKSGYSYALTKNGFTKAGYLFAGWNTSSDGTGTSYSNQESVRDLTDEHGGIVVLYAQWTPITYKVRFNANAPSYSGSLPWTISCTYGRSYQLGRASFSVAGRIFLGWNTQSDGSGVSLADAAFFSNLTDDNNGTVTLYAQWEYEAPVTYILYGGKNASQNPQYIRVNQDPVPLLEAEREGYTFGGWFAESSFVNQVTELTAESSEPIRLYAKWIPVIYKIQYKLDGGTNHEDNPSEYTKESLTIYLQDPSRNGSIFEGWYLDSQYSSKVTQIANGSIGDKTLYAKWHVPVTGITVSPQTAVVNLDETCTLTGEIYPSNANLKTIVWTSSNTQIAEVSQDGVVTGIAPGTAVITASASEGSFEAACEVTVRNKYSISYNANGGSGQIDDQTDLLSGVSYTLTENSFTKTGYRFTGWNTSEDGSGASYAEKAEVTDLTDDVNGNVVLYAQWTPITYTVMYDANGNSLAEDIPEPTACTYDQSYDLTSIASESGGMTFAGWNTRADGTGQAYSNGASYKNLASEEGAKITLYAQWTYNAPTITGVDKKEDVIVYETANLIITVNVPGYADGIHLYRAKGTTGEYTLAATLEDISSGTVTYDDGGLSCSTAYSYYAAAYEIDETGHAVERASSEAVSGTTAEKTVIIPKLNVSEVYVEIGSSFQVTAKAGTVTSWSVSNESYATVDENGLVTGVVSTGSLSSSKLPVLTATFSDGTVIECKINVCEEWRFSKYSCSVEQGEDFNLNDTSSYYDWMEVYMYGGVKESDNYSYSVENPDLLTEDYFNSYSGYLVLNTYKPGTTKVSITSAKLQKTLTVEVTLTENFYFRKYENSAYVPVTEVQLTAGHTETLDLKVDFCNTCKWSVSDSEVVELTSSNSIYRRTVKGLKGGTATVTVTNELGQTASATITVCETPETVTFSKTAYDVYLGVESKLEFTAYPESEHYRVLVEPYSSWDKNDVQFDEDGTFHPLVSGETKWRIVIGDYKSSYITIKTYRPTLQQDIKLYRKETFQLNYADINEKAAWVSSDPKVVSVKNGKLTALNAGTATITASYNGFEASTKVIVQNPKLSASTLKMYMKSSKALRVTGGVGPVSWSSSNKGIATVNSAGTVKGIRPGTVTITAKVSGVSLTCRVTVNKPALSRTTVIAYLNVPLTLKVNGGDGAIKWKSSKKKVAKVNSRGVITPKKKGTTYITATRNGYKMTCKVKVVNNKYSEWVDKNARNYTYGEPVEMLSKVYYKGKTMIAEIYIMNARMFRADRFDWWTIWLYDNDDNLIACKKLKKYKLGIKPYGTKKVKIKFKGKEIKKKNVILNRGVYLEDDWYYHYSY